MTTAKLDSQDIARVITEALPYIKRYKGETVVVKYGGNAMIDDTLKEAVARDIVLMKLVGMNPILVHGGGPQINKTLERLNIESSFKNGLRVTDDKVMDVVEMVLAGSVNQDIVHLINQQGGHAIGLSGKDSNFITAEKLLGDDDEGRPTLDIGHVGKVQKVHTQILSTLQQDGFIPVIAPIGVGENGQTYNINADSVASAIAVALKAKNFVVLSNIKGVLDKEDNLITSLNKQEINTLKKNGTIHGGMIPKVDGAIAAIEEGVERITFIDGRVPHALLLEIFTDRGVGTQIIA